jgi:predicted ATPase
MITKITVENFKSHEHTVIEADRVTALVGPNGAGKTSLLQAISYPDFLIDHPFEKAALLNLDPVDFVKRSKDEFCIQQEHRIADKQWGISARFFQEAKKAKEWRTEIKWKYDNESGEVNLDSHHLLVNHVPDFIRVIWGGSFYFKPILRNLSAASVNEGPFPVVNSDGRGLASAVSFLMTSRRTEFEKVENALRSIAPLVDEVLIKPAKVITQGNRTVRVDDSVYSHIEKREEWGDALFFNTSGATEVPAKEMSEGTLITLSVLTILFNFYSPGTLLFDDIEAGLHPLAQRKLMQVLKEFAEKYDRQIILTTHSPYIVDELEAKDVWVMALDKDGITRTQRLSEHPNAERALEVLTTGELLSAEGEDWVLDDPIPAEQVNA